MTNWQQLDELNEWTGKVRTRHIMQINTSDRTGRAYLEVHRVGDRYQWSTHIMVVNRPDLSRMAYGSVAVTPHSLPVAKMLASRRAFKTIRAVEPLTRAA
jgi:hypothetical protein